MSRRIRFKSSQFAKRRRRVFIVRSLFFLFLFSSVVGLVGWVAGSEKVTVQDIKVEGNSMVTTESIRALAKKDMEGKYLFVFPKSSIFLYPRKGIEASVLESFKRVKNAKVTFDGFQSISINIDEREPKALWCGESYLSEEKGGCYFLDEGGFVFSKAPNFSGTTFLSFFGMLDSFNPVGEQFIPQEEFATVLLFVESLNKIYTESVAVEFISTEETVVYTKNGSKILFTRSQNLGAILSNIESVLESEEFKDKLVDFEYLDARFGNKVYYKFKEQKNQRE